MATKVATKPKQGGKRSKRGPRKSRAEVDRNLELADKLLGDGQGRQAVMAKLGARGVAAASVDRYIARVYDRWKEERQLVAPALVEQRLERLNRLARKFEKERKYIPLVQVEKMLNLMLGVNAPERHEVKGAVAVAGVVAPPVFDPGLLDDQELAAVKSAAAKMMRQAAPAGLIGDTTAVEAE
jgi:uncharacterized protein YigA (DUF484 family)